LKIPYHEPEKRVINNTVMYNESKKVKNTVFYNELKKAKNTVMFHALKKKVKSSGILATFGKIYGIAQRKI
jgi:hypothetical protein